MSGRLKYHQKTFDLLGEEPPEFSGKLIDLLRERERSCGVKFPESVIEWYSLENGFEILKKHSRADDPYPIAALGKAFDNWYGGGPHDFIKDGLLMIFHENQGVCNLAVKLDGSEDPAVMIEVDSSPNMVWTAYVEHFSDFVYTQVWDNNYSQYEYVFTAIDGNLTPNTISYLKKILDEDIRTFGWPGDVNYRFYSQGKKILIWDSKRAQQADWYVAGKSKDVTIDLIKQIYMCGDLKNSLGRWDTNGLDVLNEAKQLCETSGR